MKARLGCRGGSASASLPSGNTFHCPLVAPWHSTSVWRASLEDKASGYLLVTALAVERQLGSCGCDDTAFQAVFCEGDSLGNGGPSRRPRQLVVGLALQCSLFYPEGLRRDGFELSGDDTESSVLAALQLVQSVWSQPGLPGWGSLVDNTEMKGPRDFEELIFPPAPPFGGHCQLL